MLKTYIKINLANSFISSSNFFTGVFNFVDQKQDKNFCFCINYWGFNNFIIKNQYLLSLIDKLLD